MVARVNALEPDLVAITGDIFDRDPSHLPEALHLEGLRARHGVFAILGNHDADVGSDRVADALAQHAPGVRLLRNELLAAVRRPVLHRRLEDPAIPGSTAAFRYAARALTRAGRRRPGLLLAHAGGVSCTRGARFTLVLRAHHGPARSAEPRRALEPARVMTPLTRGVYRSGSTTLYVNRGLGVGGPAMRFHCTREIATIELAPSV